MPTQEEKLQELKNNLLRQMEQEAEMTNPKRNLHLRMTKFGLVKNQLLTIRHNRPLRKKEIIGQYIRDKITGKKETFLWMGQVEKSEYDPVTLSYKISYRPFVNQHEKEVEREEQLYTKQMFGGK